MGVQIHVWRDLPTCNLSLCSFVSMVLNFSGSSQQGRKDVMHLRFSRKTLLFIVGNVGHPTSRTPIRRTPPTSMRRCDEHNKLLILEEDTKQFGVC